MPGLECLPDESCVVKLLTLFSHDLNAQVSELLLDKLSQSSFLLCMGHLVGR